MDRGDRLDFLRRLPHFATLSPELLARVDACCTERELRAGEALFAAGERCAGFFAVRAGAVELYRLDAEGRRQVVNRFGPGRSFAEAALFSFGRYPVHAVATRTPTRLLEVRGEAFRRLLDEERELAPAMVGSLCMRLAALVERVEELSLPGADARLARWLLRQPAGGGGERPTVELPMQKRELAAHLAMTPETLSRLLRRWQEGGWILSERGRVVVLDEPALLALADGAARA